MAKVLVEYVRLDRAGERERESSVLLGLAGQPETLSEIGDTPVLTAGAPAWGKEGGVIVPAGYGRITVLLGAVLSNWGGTKPDPSKGVRIVAGSREILVHLKEGEKISFIEATAEQEVGGARADLQAEGNAALSELAGAASGPGLRILPPNTQPAGVSPVTGAFTSHAQSGEFAAAIGRPINISLAPQDGWIGTVRLMRRFPGDTAFLPLTMLGKPWGLFTGAVSEPVWEEAEAGCVFMLECDHVAGSISYRISQ